MFRLRSVFLVMALALQFLFTTAYSLPAGIEQLGCNQCCWCTPSCECAEPTSAIHYVFCCGEMCELEVEYGDLQPVDYCSRIATNYFYWTCSCVENCFDRVLIQYFTQHTCISICCI